MWEKASFALGQWTLIRAHLRGGVSIFQAKKCSLENVNNSVQISSSQLLLSKRYSKLKFLCNCGLDCY